ncbi:MAG: 3-hydroxylacyl-ACP dehydratase [Nitrospinales bacterium]
MSLTKDDIIELIPHGPSMCLLDSVVNWDTIQIQCLATSHRNIDNPLRNKNELSSLSGIEYAAQSMAVHGALLNKKRARNEGLLLSVKDIFLKVQRLDNISFNLIFDSKILMADDNMFNYEFKVSANNNNLLTGKASVFYTGKEIL